MNDEFKYQVNHLTSLNQRFLSLSESERAILSTLRILKSEADVLNSVLRHIASLRQDRSSEILQSNIDLQRKEADSTKMNSLRGSQNDDDIHLLGLNLTEMDNDADAVKRLENALFCDDLNTSSDESSAS